jgi:ribonuclease HIII
VLAREAFLRALLRLSTETGIAVPKGASEQVRAAAAELVRKHGVDALLRACKCHFRTTDQVLGVCGKTRADLPPEGRVISRTMEPTEGAAKRAHA